MKYFTSEWWESGCEDETVFSKYSTYYNSIKSKLPVKLCDLYEVHTLHDANIKSIYSDYSANRLTLKLSGWDQEFKNKKKYSILFSGVTEFNQELPKDDYVESELGDLGYYEYELLETCIEMRMLFASGAEFQVIFHDFNYEHEHEKA